MYTICATSIFLPIPAGGDPFTDLMKPGDVISGHAEFESECKSCHERFQKKSQSTLCMDCHEDIAADVKDSTGFHGRALEVQLSECRECHTDHEGRDEEIASFDHDAFEHSVTDFPLLGAHSGSECDGCHVEDEKYREAPSNCFACHSEDDKHNGELGESCSDCHTQRDWTEAKFDHSETGWPLLGKHEDVECDSCHASDTYLNTPTICVECHREDDEHRGHYGPDCDTCHVSDGWSVGRFNHYRDTGYRLEGGHRNIACVDCHVEPIYEVALDQACQSCHLEDDVHEGLRGTECSLCHEFSDWERSEFDHDAFTGFALVGAHGEAECESCHVEPADLVTLPTDCFDCHQEDDPHDGQEGQRCERCHNERAWDQDVVFDHDLTLFPLLGKHAEEECSQCHETQAFQDADTDCVSCHLEDDFHEGNLGDDCGSCHTPVGWEVWEFDHARTGYELTGAHDSIECDACHSDRHGIRIKTPPTLCGDCHEQDDVHLGEFGPQCDRCHITDNFNEILSVN